MVTKTEQSYNLRALEGLYREVHGYRTNLRFAADELSFFDHLIKSYNFQPNTKDLFERLQLFERRIHAAKEDIDVFLSRINNQEALLGGMMECTEPGLDREFYRSYDGLTTDLNNFLAGHHDLKLEVFNYIGGFLKKRKPA